MESPRGHISEKGDNIRQAEGRNQSMEVRDHFKAYNFKKNIYVFEEMSIGPSPSWK